MHGSVKCACGHTQGGHHAVTGDCWGTDCPCPGFSKDNHLDNVQLVEDAADAIADWINGVPCSNEANARLLVNRISTLKIDGRPELAEIEALCKRVIDILERDGEYHAEDLADEVLAIIADQ